MESKIEYFISRTERDLADLKKDIHHIRQAVDALKNFKFLSLGVVVGVSTICSVLASIVTIYLKTN